MEICNRAFITLCNRMDGILSACFDESPRGDSARVKAAADKLMLLLTNSFYSLTWVNIKDAERSYPGNINKNNLAQIKEVSDEAHL